MVTRTVLPGFALLGCVVLGGLVPGPAVALPVDGVAAAVTAEAAAPVPEPTAPPEQEPTCAAGQASAWIPRDTSAVVRLGLAQARAVPGPREPVTVAVVDAGVGTGNPHLEPALLPAVSLVQPEPGESGEARREREHHGTQIAAIVAARDLRPALPSAVAGVDPTALVQPVDFYTRAESEVPGNALSSDGLAAGIRAATDSGARVINVSFSAALPTPELEAAVGAAVAAGRLVVASAGNDRADGDRYPAAYPGVLSVSAVDSAGVAPADAPRGDAVDLAAPGSDLVGVSAVRDCRLSGVGDPPDSSWAAAYVSGAAALVWSAFPGATAEEVAYRLTASADRPQRASRDDTTGWGVVQPYGALTMTLDPARPGPPLPGAQPPEVEAASPGRVVVERTTDPLAGTRRAVVGAALVGVAVLGLLLLLTRWNRLAGRRS